MGNCYGCCEEDDEVQYSDLRTSQQSQDPARVYRRNHHHANQCDPSQLNLRPAQVDRIPYPNEQFQAQQYQTQVHVLTNPSPSELPDDQQSRAQTVKTTDPKQQLYASQQGSYNSELVTKGASSNKKIQNPYKKLISDVVRKSSSSSQQRLREHVRGADNSASLREDTITHTIKVEYNDIYLVIKASKLLEYLIEGYLKTNNSTQRSLGIVCGNHIHVMHLTYKYNISITVLEWYYICMYIDTHIVD
mgnify:CR=1 FL=1